MTAGVTSRAVTAGGRGGMRGDSVPTMTECMCPYFKTWSFWGYFRNFSEMILSILFKWVSKLLLPSVYG